MVSVCSSYVDDCVCGIKTPVLRMVLERGDEDEVASCDAGEQPEGQVDLLACGLTAEELADLELDVLNRESC